MRTLLIFFLSLTLNSESVGQSFSDVSFLLDNSNVGVFAVGTSIADLNSDGLLDLYRHQGVFFHQRDGTFIESTDEVGFRNEDGTTAEGSTVFGAIFADYDNDGYLDVFFEDLISGSRLFKNRGDGSFFQANDEADVHVTSAVQGSVWADFDNDGLLDLFVGGDGDASSLFLNNGDSTFFDASANVAYSPFRNVYGVAAADFDNDGDIDIYLSSCSQDVDASRNMLFRNDGTAGFTDIAPSLGINDSSGGWAVLWVDVNNDTFLDLFVANQRISGVGIETRLGFNRLYVNDGSGGFVDMAGLMGIAGPEDEFTIGATSADFNNDGYVDIITTTNDGSGPTIYINNGGSSFNEATPEALNGISGQAISSADINGDGWIDLFVASFQGDHLFYNDGGESNWLTVTLSGNQSNYNGIGSGIAVYAPGLTLYREIVSGDGMTAQNGGLRAHFGLAEHVTIDSLVVTWPSGIRDVVSGFPTNQAIRITEGNGINHAPETFSLVQPAPGSILGAPTLVDFVWHSSGDKDNDLLVYRLKLLDPKGNMLSMVETEDTTASIDGSMLQSEVTYRWTVDVRDGYSVVRSTDRSAFTVAIPSSTETEPNEGLTTIAAHPNPFGSTVNIAVQTRNDSILEMSVFNVTGDLISVLPKVRALAGYAEFVWDGRQSNGSKAPSGVYLYRITGGSTIASGTVVKI